LKEEGGHGDRYLSRRKTRPARLTATPLDIA
jgi:hypothetical protein